MGDIGKRVIMLDLCPLDLGEAPSEAPAELDKPAPVPAVASSTSAR